MDRIASTRVERAMVTPRTIASLAHLRSAIRPPRGATPKHPCVRTQRDLQSAHCVCLYAALGTSGASVIGRG